MPRSAGLAAYRVADGFEAPPPEAETFQLIRAQLRSFNGGLSPGSVLVTSAVAGEGKSTVAFHLAAAAAQTGSRVLLIEANLRRPSLASRLSLADSPSLLEAMVDPTTMNYAARYPLQSVAERSSLSLLPAGTPDGAMNPAAAIDSQAMDRVLAGAAGAFDLVVVDGPDLGGISDVFLLARKIDGLLIVGLNGRSRRDLAEDLSRRLRASGARIFGVVANGVGRSREGRGGRRRGRAKSGSQATGALAAVPSPADAGGEMASSARMQA